MSVISAKITGLGKVCTQASRVGYGAEVWVKVEVGATVGVRAEVDIGAISGVKRQDAVQEEKKSYHKVGAWKQKLLVLCKPRRRQCQIEVLFELYKTHICFTKNPDNQEEEYWLLFQTLFMFVTLTLLTKYIWKV